MVIGLHSVPVTVTAQVQAAAADLMVPGGRALLGIAGKPGAGKSTVAAALARALGARVRVVPMDGFHLSNWQLARLGRAARKGAPDTFDAHGYRALLARLRASGPQDPTIYAPGFCRAIEEPVAASLAVEADTELVITEGNYLLLDEPPWRDVRAELDAVWYLALATDLRERRLVARHMHHGRSETEARAWLMATDRANAERIGASVGRADRRLCWRGDRVVFAAT